MDRIHDMLKAHPEQMQIARDLLADCLQQVYDCSQLCDVCVDACLGDEAVKDLVRVIGLCRDCAHVCQATGRALSQNARLDLSLKRSQIANCIRACQMCGAECAKFKIRFEYCRMCADACRRCEDACTELIRAVPVTV